MLKDRFASRLLLVALVLGALASAVVIGGWYLGPSWYLQRKALPDEIAERRARLVVRELSELGYESDSGQIVRVGYAEFALPSGEDFSVWSRRGAVVVEGAHASVLFMPPFNPRNVLSREELGNMLSGYDISAVPEDATFLDVEFGIEATYPVSIVALSIMPTDRRTAYLMRLLEKAHLAGHCGVYEYRSDSIRALVRIGTRSDAGITCKEASLHIEDLKRQRAVGATVWVNGKEKGADVTRVLVPLLRGFQFTDQNMGSIERVQELLHKAGVEERPSPNRQPDQPHE